MFPMIPLCLRGYGALMDAYEHFQLNKPPFDPLPDAEFFFDAPVHAETLATLQYVVYARKGCCVAIGESGYGKTLLARIVADNATATTPVLWVHGGGQPDNQTNVSVFLPHRFARAGQNVQVEKTTLAAEAHTTRFRPEPPLLIVDSADDLPAHGWRDVIAWFSNEIRYSKPANVLLFGLPRLLDMLMTPELVRLQRRVFRVCRLEALTPRLTKEYIRTRVAIAGGDSRRIFSDDVVDQISRLGHGNPALINQLCDNTMLEAFGEERDRVQAVDVGNALHVMLMGRLKERVALPPPAQSIRPALPPISGSFPRRPVPSVRKAQPVVDTPVSATPVVEESVERRLRQFANRLSQAMCLVRVSHDGHDGVDYDTPIVSGVPRGIQDDSCSSIRSVRVETQTRTDGNVEAQPTVETG